MVKGSPPHSNMVAARAIQLIPKVKPPRLAETEGSKDLRDFMTFCLTESPNDVRDLSNFLAANTHYFLSDYLQRSY